MKAIALVEIGIEPVCQRELQEKIDIKGEITQGAVTFSASPEKIIQFAYQSQSASRILIIISTFTAEYDLKKTAISFDKHLPRTLPIPPLPHIRVDCERSGNHAWTSMDAEAEFGDILLKKYKLSGASMNTPDMIFYAYIRGTSGHLGIDLSGRNLAKRNYKIYAMPATIRGPLAYALLRIGGYEEGQAILDPFCGIGTIPIEAALATSRTSPHFFHKEFPFLKLMLPFKPQSIITKIDARQKKQKKKKIFGSDKELRYIQSATKNAKIAGIEKHIDFSRCDIEWLDTKFEKHSIDIIATEPPHDSKHTAKEREKTLKEFFYQAAFILKKNGRITILCNTPLPPEDAAGKEGFHLHLTHSLSSGQQSYTIFVYTR
jgi:23S rRNA G2445 N2-methylase RlmL